MTDSILVTGATGSLGRKVVQYLVHRGKTVRAGVHRMDKAEYVRMDGVEITALEFGDFATVDRSLEGIETLFLITPVAREQVEYTRRMVDRARLWGVSHIVKLSMLGADDVPGTQLSRWHRQSEYYIEDSGIPFTFIRPNLLMHNFLRYAQPMGSFIYMPLDQAEVSYIDLRDVAKFCAEIIVRAQEFSGWSLDITGPEALSMENIARILTETTGHHISFIDISEETAIHLLESTGTPMWLSRTLVEHLSVQRTGRFSLVTDAFKEITGKDPHDFNKFANDYSSVFKAIVQQEHHTFLS